MNSNRKIVDDRLDRWFQKLGEDHSKDFFPQPLGYGYIGRYQSISTALEPIHKEVEKGAMLKCFKQAGDCEFNIDQIVYLNNHGPEHVAHVIEKASDILKDSKYPISPYEAYLLLTAIQFHDVGNLYGRENHELNCLKVMQRLGEIVGNDQPEKEAIIQIAAAHSGNINGNKDKISRLVMENDFLMCQEIRRYFIAATLRFADELADDQRRANRFVFESDVVPEESKLFHAYSLALHSVVVKDAIVFLNYTMDHDTAKKKFPKKNGKEVFLLDEIRDRILKMHLERVYCMRFFDPGKRIERIKVIIDIYPNFKTDRPLNEDAKIRISGTVMEMEYPELPVNNLDGLCTDEMQNKTGEWLVNQIFSRGRS